MEKVAIIELNSTDLKLLILETEKNGYYNCIDELVEPIKLGVDITEGQIIRPSKLVEALNTLKMFRKVCDNNDVVKVIAIATSVIKQAKNQKSFFEEVYNNTTFNFSILTEEEEIKYIFHGVSSAIDVPRGIILDIRPTKTYIINYNRRNVLASNILDFGSVSLADMFASITDPNEKWNNIVNYVSEQLNEIEVEYDEDTIFVGAEETYLSLGKLARKLTKYPLDIDNNYIADSKSLQAVYDVIKGLEADKTKKLKGISTERADAFVAGAAISCAIQNKLNINQIAISAGTFTDGIIFANLVIENNDKYASDALGYCLDNIIKFYSKTNSNNHHVYNLALILFRQLKVLHKLPRLYLKALRIASSMYDCGKRIRFDNYSKMSLDIITNSKLAGVSHKDLILAGFACVCQDSDNFQLSEWMKYASMVNEEDLDAVRKLGVIVSLAASLDRSRNSNVTDICCDILGDSIIIKTIVKNTPEFDIIQAMKLASDFKKIFKKNLQII